MPMMLMLPPLYTPLRRCRYDAAASFRRDAITRAILCDAPLRFSIRMSADDYAYG